MMNLMMRRIIIYLKNEKSVNGEEGNDTGINKSTENGSSTSGEIDKKHKKGKISLLKHLHEMCDGDNGNDNIGGDDVASVEESEMRSSAYSVNVNDNLVSGFDASTLQVTMFMTLLEIKTLLLVMIQLFGSTPIEIYGKGGSLYFLTVICHSIPMIKN